MLENFNEDKRKNSMTQFSDFHTGWSISQKSIWDYFITFTCQNHFNRILTLKESNNL